MIELLHAPSNAAAEYNGGGANSNGPILRISDSGRGMDLHELRAWATLGETVAQSQRPQNEDAASSSSSSSSKSTSEEDGGEKSLLGSLGRYGVGGKHAAFQLASSVTVSTRPRGAPFVYEATLDAQVLSEDLGSSSSRPYMSHHHRSKGGSSKGSKALLKGQQHKWIAELRVRTATPEEEALELPSWTRLELRRLKPGLIALQDTGGAGHWGGGGSLQRSLANL